MKCETKGCKKIPNKKYRYCKRCIEIKTGFRPKGLT